MLENIKVNITYKKIKNLHLRVKNQEIFISAPMRTPKAYIYKFIEKNIDFVNKQLNRQELIKLSNEIKINYEINILNKKYQILNITTKKIKYTEHFIFVNENYDIKKQIKLLFKNELLNYMTDLTKKYYQIMPLNVNFPSIVIKDVKSKWGSYNKVKNEIIYSSNLLFKDVNCYDYLVVHELAHILQFNHSKKFYDIVSKYCTNYKELRKLLKESKIK